YLKQPYDRVRHRERFMGFLKEITAGHSEYFRHLARHINEGLEPPEPVRFSPGGLWRPPQAHVRLTAFSLTNLNGKPMCAHGYKSCFCDNSPAYKRELLGRSQSVLPHSQNILTGVEVSVSVQSATRTVLGAVREGELLP